MSDIFLSYASEDRERVRPLADALAAEGWSVFWDRNIPVGKTWDERLEEEFDSVCSLVVVWSKHSVRSKWVREEANEALRRDLPIFPILLDGVLPPLGFRSIQSADFSQWDGTPASHLFQSLIQDVKNTLCRPGSPETKGTRVPAKPLDLDSAVQISPPLTAEKTPATSESEEAVSSEDQTAAAVATELFEQTTERIQDDSRLPELKPGETAETGAEEDQKETPVLQSEPTETQTGVINGQDKTPDEPEPPGKNAADAQEDRIPAKKIFSILLWLGVPAGLVLGLILFVLVVRLSPLLFPMILLLIVIVVRLVFLFPKWQSKSPAAASQGDAEPSQVLLEKDDLTASSYEDSGPGESPALTVPAMAASLSGVSENGPQKSGSGFLWVDTEPQDAAVSLSRRLYPTMSHVLKFTQGMELEPGQYEVELSAPGYESYRVSLELEAGEEKRLSLKLFPAEGQVISTAEPSGSIWRRYRLQTVLIVIGLLALSLWAILGKPKGPVPRVEKPWAAYFPEFVYFDRGQAGLDNENRQVINKLARHVKDYGLKVELEGYTSSSDWGKAKLAKRRSIVVRDALVAAGISPDRIKVKEPTSYDYDVGEPGRDNQYVRIDWFR